MRRYLMAAAVAAALGATGPALAQEASTPDTKATSQQTQANTTTFAVVTVNSREVMRLTDAGGHTAQSRASEVDKRLRQVIESEKGQATTAIKPSEVTVQKSGNLYVVRLRDANVITVTHTDAKLKEMPTQALAEQWAASLRDALSGVHVTAQEDLPEDFVTVATGQITMPMGGGAGAGVKDKENKHDKDKIKDKAKDKDKNP